MKKKFQGNAKVKHAQLQAFRIDFEVLEMKVRDYFSRVIIIVNNIRNCGEDMLHVKVVQKILCFLTKQFNYIICSIKEFDEKDGEKQALKVSSKDKPTT